ncbi:MAG: hypothetical protein AABX99_02170 [Nanoarchaeota archaeon]
MKKELIWRGLFFLLFIIFFLSSLGYLHVIDKFADYSKIANFFGLSEKAIFNNIIYLHIIGAISTIFLIIEALIIIISFSTKKEYTQLNFIKGINKFFKDKFDNLTEDTIKLMIGMFFAGVVNIFFINFQVFKCYVVTISGGLYTYCGTPEQFTYLMIAWVCLAYAVLPKKLLKRKPN